MTHNPYRNLPDSAFWRRAVRPPPSQIDPVTAVKFTVEQKDKIATAGSCFAQHISRTLVACGRNFLVTEEGGSERNYGVFPARFGNIYVVRHLHQLFRRAYATFEPVDSAWTRHDGRLVDPFRPLIEPAGFETHEALQADRAVHLKAVRRMFEEANVFVFTLGLTEGWCSTVDGAVFPLAPGVAGTPDHSNYAFCNFTVAQMTDDLRSFIDDLRCVNSTVRIILTVSPVPLIATYETRHVLVSTVYSKSALRVVSEEVSRHDGAVDYFPSYEMIAGHQAGGVYFEDDLRSVSTRGVKYVMDTFSRHYLAATTGLSLPPPMVPSGVQFEPSDTDALRDIVCDEELLEQ